MRVVLRYVYPYLQYEVSKNGNPATMFLVFNMPD